MVPSRISHWSSWLIKCTDRPVVAMQDECYHQDGTWQLTAYCLVSCLFPKSESHSQASSCTNKPVVARWVLSARWAIIAGAV